MKESSKPVVLLILSEFFCLKVPTGIFILRNVDVTESIISCEYNEEENNKQVKRSQANGRRIKFDLKINLPVVINRGNRTKVDVEICDIEQKL